MAAAIPIYREKTPGGARERFYVPYYQVKIEGRDLPDDVVNDVIQVTYKDKVDDLDNFQITINNWDAQEQRLKFEPALPKYKGLFDPGQRVEILIGYVQNLRKVLIGDITTVQAAYPEAGMPTLTVSGLNILHAFRKKQHTCSWENKTDSEIAREIAINPTSDNRPGLGLRALRMELLTPDEGTEQPLKYVFMNNQYDIIFLLDRARQRGYSVRLEMGIDPQTKREVPARLIFGREESTRDVTYELEWGKTLCSFTPTVQTANQIASVTVKGWDHRAKQPISATAELGKLPNDAGVNRDWENRIARAVNGRHEEITNEPVHSRADAERLAKKILADQRRGMITAKGTTVGLPDLRAGRKVVILGFGAKRVDDQVQKTEQGAFDGEYFVTETTHTIGDHGYRTDFTARREGKVP